MNLLRRPRRFWRKVRLEIVKFRVMRSDPRPEVDKRLFDLVWARTGWRDPDGRQILFDPSSDEFRLGEQPHQVVQAKAIFDEYGRSGRVLNTLTSEAANYLVIFVMFTGLIGFATTSVAVLLRQTPNGALVVLPGAVLFILLTSALVALVRSHASKLRSWKDNYIGTGRRVYKITTQYAYVNRKREDTMRNNAYAQKAKRMLSLVATLYTMSVVLLCLAVAIGAALLQRS